MTWSRRGEIPTVCVPRRAEPELHDSTTIVATRTNLPVKEVQSASRDPARDPP